MSAAFEADLDPETRNPRLRFNFANGWTGSLVLRTLSTNHCNAWATSLAVWPTGQHGQGLTGLGPTEASADEAIFWLAGVAAREPVQ